MARPAKRSLEAHEVHQPESETLPATGALPERDAVIERVSDMSSIGEKAKMLTFMEEPVTIQIHEGMDPNSPEPTVFCAVNGEGAGPKKIPYLPRGKPITVKRKFVEVLARARKIGISTTETHDHKGDLTTRIDKKSAMAYPFQVIEDRNPAGIAWLQRVLAEA